MTFEEFKEKWNFIKNIKPEEFETMKTEFANDFAEVSEIKENKNIEFEEDSE